MFRNIKLYLIAICAFMMSTASSFGVTIRYNLNGGHLADSDDTTFSVEPSGDEIFLANPVRDGFTFAGWCEKNDADDWYCDNPLGQVEENGKKYWQWVVPSNVNTDTEYVALWDFNKITNCSELPSPSVSAGWVFITNGWSYDFDNDGKEIVPEECGATLVYATNPSAFVNSHTLADYINAGVESFTFCRYNTIYHKYFCSVAPSVCSQDEVVAWLQSFYGNTGDGEKLDSLAQSVTDDPNATKDDLVWNQPSDDITIHDRCSNTCNVQLSILGVPMCMITDSNDASNPALTVIHENGPYYINLVTEEDSENPAPLVTGSEHAIRIIAAGGTYNVVGESPASND